LGGGALEGFVLAVAEDWAGAVLASAEVGDLGFCGFELDGGEVAALVASVAKGLAGALAAGTPVIALAGFNLNWIRTLLGDGGF